MTRQLEAVFEGGVLRPLEPLPLREKQRVLITITDTPSGAEDFTRKAEMEWLHQHEHFYSYPSDDKGILLPVILRSGNDFIDFRAYIDTGSSNCLFERKYGELLNLNIEAGEPKKFGPQPDG